MAEGLPVVGEVEQRGQRVAPDPMGGIGYVDDAGVDGQQGDDQKQRWHQPHASSGIEAPEADATLASALCCQHGGDQEARQHEEDLECHPGSWQRLEVRVIDQDRGEGEGPDARERWSVAQPEGP